MKTASPPSITGLRPKRSASGPTASGEVEKPARKIAIAAAVRLSLEPNSAYTSVRLGSAMSIASGGSAVIAARKARKARP